MRRSCDLESDSITALVEPRSVSETLIVGMELRGDDVDVERSGFQHCKLVWEATLRNHLMLPTTFASGKGKCEHGTASVEQDL